MIPLSDVSRRPTTFPVVTLTIVVVNVVVFIAELTNGDAFVERWSMVPAHVIAGRDLVTLLTAMFMHASWLHIVGNMVFLWAFGPEIEDDMGPLRYAIFYVLGGLIAAGAQIAFDPYSTVPNLGASGAIAAVMGAFVVTFPRDRIRTVLFLFVFITIAYVPSIALIGFWFLTQIWSVGQIAPHESTGVAYLAHIGGFIFGAVFARLFERGSRYAGGQ